MKKEISAVIFTLSVFLIGLLIGIYLTSTHRDMMDLNAEQCRQINRNEIQGSMPSVDAKEPVMYNLMEVGDSIKHKFNNYNK